MKILLAAGATLLIVVMAVPFQAQVSSSTESPGTAPMALAIAPPIVVAPGPGSTTAGPGLQIAIGSALIGLGSLVRRVSKGEAPVGE